MANTQISTGAIHLGTRGLNTRPTGTQGGHFHIAILGDFSGRGSRGDLSLNTCTPIAIDRDNFAEVFAALRVRLQLPFCESPLEFADLDELHPDFLLGNLALCERFKVLKNRLKKPELFAAAAAELQAMGVKGTADAQAATRPTEPRQAPENLLESIFASMPSAAQQASPLGDVDQFIKQLVAPYAQTKSEPRLPDLLAAVDEATSQTLRGILHQSAFQTLEANWRSLYFLVRRLNTNTRLKIFIIDASQAALVQDAKQQPDPTQTALYKLLVTHYQTPGKIAFSCLQANWELNDNLDDLNLAANMALIAGSLGAISLLGGSEKLAGCAALSTQPDAADWNYIPNPEFSAAWQAFRASELSRHLAVVAPKFLLRLPYGKKTSPIDTFDFTELPANHPNNYYLWGNSASLVSLVLGENFLQFGTGFSTRIASQIDDLPMHVYTQDGVSHITPCAEIAILDSAAKRFTQAGLLVVRSIHNQNAVLIPALHSAAENGELILSGGEG